VEKRENALRGKDFRKRKNVDALWKKTEEKFVNKKQTDVSSKCWFW
jgi:hypothetical protein